MRKLISALVLVACLASAAFAGDIPTLVNLGFSGDAAYFMFGYYGVDAVSSKPYAEIYVVDTAKNQFVPSATFKGLYAADLQPGWNASGAFFRLFSEAAPVARKLGIDHLAQGRLAYMLVDGAERPDAISFKDFSNGAQWEVNLREVVEEKAGSVSSSFGIEFTVTKADGKKISAKAGNPLIKRAGVKDYTISRIILGADERTVVFFIEKLETTPSGPTIRYMVETLRLP